jgi:hypothetical protein
MEMSKYRFNHYYPHRKDWIPVDPHKGSKGSREPHYAWRCVCDNCIMRRTKWRGKRKWIEKTQEERT